MIPGEYFLSDEPINLNAGRESIEINVVNLGDRPVQIGSHFHFFEVNPQMEFDREKAFGKRLDIPAGTAVRFEPGESKKISLIAFGGLQCAMGFNQLSQGKTSSDENRKKAMEKIKTSGFKNKPS